MARGTLAGAECGHVAARGGPARLRSPRYDAHPHRVAAAFAGGREGAGVRVHPLRTANMLSPPALLERPQRPGRGCCAGWACHIPRSRWLTLPIPCFLVEHPAAGPFLIDTGLHASVASDPAPNLGQRRQGAVLDRHGSPTDAAPAQVRARGVDPDAIGLVADDAPALRPRQRRDAVPRRDVPGRSTRMGRREQRRHSGRATTARTWTPALRWRAIDVGSEADLFGDGSVRLLHTPGHTPGHLSLLLRLEGGERLLAHRRRRVRAAHARRAAACRCSSTTTTPTWHSLDRLIALSGEADHVVCGHDPDGLQARRRRVRLTRATFARRIGLQGSMRRWPLLLLGSRSCACPPAACRAPGRDRRRRSRGDVHGRVETAAVARVALPGRARTVAVAPDGSRAWFGVGSRVFAGRSRLPPGRPRRSASAAASRRSPSRPTGRGSTRPGAGAIAVDRHQRGDPTCAGAPRGTRDLPRRHAARGAVRPADRRRRPAARAARAPRPPASERAGLLAARLALGARGPRGVRPRSAAAAIHLGRGYGGGLAIGTDGRRAYAGAARGHGRTAIVDLRTGRVRARIATGRGPGFPAVAPDGVRVYVGNARPAHGRGAERGARPPPGHPAPAGAPCAPRRSRCSPGSPTRSGTPGERHDQGHARRRPHPRPRGRRRARRRARARLRVRRARQRHCSTAARAATPSTASDGDDRMTGGSGNDTIDRRRGQRQSRTPARATTTSTAARATTRSTAATATTSSSAARQRPDRRGAAGQRLPARRRPRRRLRRRRARPGPHRRRRRRRPAARLQRQRVHRRRRRQRHDRRRHGRRQPLRPRRRRRDPRRRRARPHLRGRRRRHDRRRVGRRPPRRAATAPTRSSPGPAPTSSSPAAATTPCGSRTPTPTRSTAARATTRSTSRATRRRATRCVRARWSCQTAPEPSTDAPPPAGVIAGTPGDDVLVGTDLPDTLLAADGNDELFGNGGDDYVDGEDGNDALHGGLGNDELHGRGGDDVLLGNEGDDHLEGERGHDTVLGEDGNDVLYGGLDDDSARRRPGRRPHQHRRRRLRHRHLRPRRTTASTPTPPTRSPPTARTSTSDELRGLSPQFVSAARGRARVRVVALPAASVARTRMRIDEPVVCGGPRATTARSAAREGRSETRRRAFAAAVTPARADALRGDLQRAPLAARDGRDEPLGVQDALPAAARSVDLQRRRAGGWRRPPPPGVPPLGADGGVGSAAPASRGDAGRPARRATPRRRDRRRPRRSR